MSLIGFAFSLDAETEFTSDEIGRENVFITVICHVFKNTSARILELASVMNRIYWGGGTYEYEGKNIDRYTRCLHR